MKNVKILTVVMILITSVLSASAKPGRLGDGIGKIYSTAMNGNAMVFHGQYENISVKVDSPLESFIDELSWLVSCAVLIGLLISYVLQKQTEKSGRRTAIIKKEVLFLKRGSLLED